MKKIIYLYIPLLLIISISLITLYQYRMDYFIKQSIWLFLGIIILLSGKFLKINKVLNYAKYLYFFNLFLLILVLFIGSEINGSRAWFNFNFFSFQPSEFMKLSLAIYLNDIFKKKEKYYFIKSLLILIVPSILVFLEPDTGAILMYLIIYLASLFYSLKRKNIFYIFCFILLSFMGIFIYLYFYNIDFLIKILGTSIFYRIDRILNFKNNYQLENALICIGTAKLIGRGNKPLIYIPESVTDFMFARVISIWGLIGGIILIVSYFMIFIYLTYKLEENNDEIFCFSFIWLFLYQIIQNIFMNIGLLPIMGIPLPFLSYGGSNTIIYFIFLTLIIFNKKRINKLHSR